MEATQIIYIYPYMIYQTKPNKTYLSLLIISLWKCQKNDNVMVTSATDLGDIQTKDNDIVTTAVVFGDL